MEVPSLSPHFAHTKYMHSRVNVHSIHIYLTPTSCRDHAWWHRAITHILVFGDPPVKLPVIMQWRYPINNMLGKERRTHWTLWGSERRHHKGVNVGGFSEPPDLGDAEVRAGWWVGSPVGLLPLPQPRQLHFHLFHILGFQMKRSSEKKTPILKKCLKTHQPSPALSFYYIRNWDSERLGLLFRTVTG